MKVLGVSVDEKEESLQMKRELALDFPLLTDQGEVVIKQYGLLHEGGNGKDIARPAEILIDEGGMIRWVVFTDNIRVRPHPDVVLAEVRKLR